MDIAIGILAVFREGRWRILIARQREQQLSDGYWELPGDKILAGETPEEGLRREFVEELGLEVKIGRKLPVIELDFKPEMVRLHPFYCTLEDHTAEAKNLKMAEHRWITADEIGDYEYPTANEQLIRDVAVLLGQHDGESS